MAEKNGVKVMSDRVSELERKLVSKREQVSAALLDGKEVSKLLTEQAGFEQELSASRQALELARTREGEASESARIVEREAARRECEQLLKQSEEITGEILSAVLLLRGQVSEWCALASRQDTLKAKYHIKAPSIGAGNNARYVRIIGDVFSKYLNLLRMENRFAPSPVSRKYTDEYKKFE